MSIQEFVNVLNQLCEFDINWDDIIKLSKVNKELSIKIKLADELADALKIENNKQQELIVKLNDNKSSLKNEINDLKNKITIMEKELLQTKTANEQIKEDHKSLTRVSNIIGINKQLAQAQNYIKILESQCGKKNIPTPNKNIINNDIEEEDEGEYEEFDEGDIEGDI